MTLRSKEILVFTVIILSMFIISTSCLANGQDDPATLMDKGIKALANKNYPEANKYFRKAWELDNKVHKLSRRDKKTLEYLRDESARGISRYKVAERSLARGKQYLASGQFDKAETMFKRVIKLQKYVPTSWVEEAEVQLRLIAKKRAKEKVPSTSDKPKKVVSAKNTPTKSETIPTAKREKEKVASAPPKAVVKPLKPLPIKKKVALAKKVKSVTKSRIVKPTRPTLLDEILAARRIQKQQALVDYQENKGKIRRAIKDRKFLQARDILRQTRQNLLRVKHLFSQQEFERYLLEIDGLAKFIDSEEQEYYRRQLSLQMKEAEKRKVEREQKIREEKINRIKELFAKALKLRREKKYDEAIEVCKQILEIEPKYERAQWFLEDLKDLSFYSHQTGVRATVSEETMTSLREAEEARVPWSSEIQYPKNWEELSKQRDELIRRLGKAMVGETPARSTEKKLRTTFIQDTSVFRGTLGKAFKVFKANGINIFVRWDVLEGEGITSDDEVKMEAFEGLTNISLKTALKLLIKTMGGENINYAIDSDGIVVVSTADDLTESSLTPRIGRYETRIYDLSDLLPVKLKESNLTETTGGGGEASFSGFGDEDEEDETEEEDIDEAIDDLIEMIINTIRPSTWYDNGGEGQVNVWRDRWLIVYQLPEIQEEVKDLLATIRDVQTVQIAIEARFIEVSARFLERIGVDFDIYVNRKVAATPHGLVGPALNPFRIPFTSTFLDFIGTPPSTGLPGNLSQQYGAAPTPPMFTIQGQFLDDIEVDFLIELTQIDQYSSVVQAPRVVMQNGENVYIRVYDATPYITGWETEVGETASTATPEVDYLITGLFLPVRATTWDLKYVNMELAPLHREVTDGVQIPGPIIGTGDTQTQLPSYTVPGFREKKVRTVVSVPDGGTLLLGGLKQNGEIELETGPPILSKVPILKRLFTSNASTRDNIVLLILVKPTILVREELEPGSFLGKSPLKPNLIDYSR